MVPLSPVSRCPRTKEAVVRVFVGELKKLWQGKLLLLIVAFGVITWFAFLDRDIQAFEFMQEYGMYGRYQTELFERYGETLEPEELAEFDIPAKLTEVYAAGDAIIAAKPVFAKYDIHSFEQYLGWLDDGYSVIYVDRGYTGSLLGVTVEEGGGDDAAAREYYEDRLAMDTALNAPPGSMMDEWIRLRDIENRYAHYREQLETYIQNDPRPVVVRSAERLVAAGNSSLISDFLMFQFSSYATTVGVLAVIAILVLTLPLLTVDRSRNMPSLQYSSAVGRRVLRIQFVATAMSALALSIVLTAVFFTPFLAVSGSYWNVHIMSLGIWGMWLYNITFGQYVLVLAGMIMVLCTGTACLAFILARFSSNIVTVVIKAVPTGIALAMLSAFATNAVLSDTNIVFDKIFRGQFDVPEVIVCGVVALGALIAATIVVIREARVDVA
jgi:hypothetical protein